MLVCNVCCVSYNTKDLTDQCLGQVGAALQGIPSRIGVWDNGSRDGSAACIREKHPQVLLVDHPRNIGFGRACNRLIRILPPSRYLLLVNPDTVFDPAVVRGMITCMEENPSYAVLGGQLVFPDGRRQHSFAAWPDWKTEFLGKRWLSLWNRDRFPLKSTPLSAPREVPSLIGAFLLVRLEIFQWVGGFDERYLFFLEETDLCRKVQKAGGRVIYHPGFTVEHLQGASARQNEAWSRYQYYRSLYQFLKKWDGMGVCLAVYLKNFTGVLVKGIFYLLIRLVSLGASSYGRRKAGIAWTLVRGHFSGFISWVEGREWVLSQPEENLCWFQTQEGDLPASFFENLKSLLGGGDSRPIKESRASRIWSFQSEGQGYVLKLKSRQSWFRKLRRGDFGHTLDLQSRRLSTLGISAPDSVGYGRFRNPAGGWGSFQVSRKLENTVVLNFFQEVLQEAFSPENQAPARRRLIIKLARWVRSLHDKGVFHQDLKASNILLEIRTGGGERPFHFILVDLEKISFGYFFAERFRLKNLLQIHKSFATHPAVTARDRIAFLKTYLEEDERAGRTALRGWVQRIEAAYRGWAKKHHRPVADAADR